MAVYLTRPTPDYIHAGVGAMAIIVFGGLFVLMWIRRKKGIAAIDIRDGLVSVIFSSGDRETLRGISGMEIEGVSGGRYTILEIKHAKGSSKIVPFYFKDYLRMLGELEQAAGIKVGDRQLLK